jgi:hypothetical protein
MFRVFPSGFSHGLSFMLPAKRLAAAVLLVSQIDEPLPTSRDLSEQQRAIWGTSGLSIQQLSRKSGLLVIFTPMSELRDFIVQRLPRQNRQIEERPGSVRFAVAANELAGHPVFRGIFRRTTC